MKLFIDMKTEQERNELVHEKNQLQNIFLNAPVALCILEGTEHKYILANKTYEKLNNRQADDLFVKINREVFPELTGSATFKLFDKVFEIGETFTAPEYDAMVDLINEGVLRQHYFNLSIEPL